MTIMKTVEKRYLVGFVLITCCFALWGFANDITNPMVKSFSKIFRMSVTEGALVQVAFYGGYFCMALPAALFIRRFSYKRGILMGLGLYAAGALLFLPAAKIGSYWPFLVAYFILTCGLSFLETTANPYILSMGAKETATRRLNFAQSFNPIGSLCGMFVAMNLIQARMNPLSTAERALLDEASFEAVKAADLGVVVGPYAGIGVVLVVFFIAIWRFVDPSTGSGSGDSFADARNDKSVPSTGSGSGDSFAALGMTEKAPVAMTEGDFSTPLRSGRNDNIDSFADARNDRERDFSTRPSGLGRNDNKGTLKRLLANKAYRGGVVAQFFYLGAQITCWTFIIQYGTQVFMAEGMEEQAAEILSQRMNIVAMVLFCCSRFICTALMKRFRPAGMLAVFAAAAIGLSLVVVCVGGRVGLYSLVAVSACMSLMFPTIYGLALKDVGADAEIGSAGLIMAILGGSLLPPLQALIIDQGRVAFSFIVPLICFVVVLTYGLKCIKLKVNES